jgi:mannose-6-phosphate isomerase
MIAGTVPVMSTVSSGPLPARWPLPMVNPVRDYDWGSATALARMQGRPASGRPEAELWMGAHPAAPSALDGGDGRLHRLDELVAAAPEQLLGADVAARFDGRLPFLLKVLAIARPLSLQVHPGAERARAAFEDEAQVLGEHRYSDPYPKPELLYALEPVDALCGFRPAAEAARLLALLDGPRAAAVAEPLRRHAEGEQCDGAPGSGAEGETACLEEAFEVLVTWPDDDRPAFAADMAREARRLLREEASRTPGAGLTAHDRRALMWVSRLAQQHPKDPLVVAPLLLDLVLLRPGETLFVPAGAPHAYLHGTGVEIMANSDNVLRAGLTHKAVAVEELLHVVDGRSRPQRDVIEVQLGPGEVAWRPPLPWFQLTRMRPAGQVLTAHPSVTGPQVLLCTAGEVTVACSDGGRLVLRAGSSAFVGADCRPIEVRGDGEVFRAAVGCC